MTRLNKTSSIIALYVKKEAIVKAKRSQSVAAHFAHRRKQDCDTFSHDMSEWHKQWQARFPLRNREVPLPFDHPCHRADVLAYGYVIEFQHSPLSLREFDERNQFYTSLGKKVIWVFDVSEKYQNYSFVKQEASYEFDGYYSDAKGKQKKSWIVKEYRIATTFLADGAPPEEIGDRCIDYEYGRNDKTSRLTYEWHWLHPFSTLKNYHPQVNRDITVFLEFAPGRLQRIIWCMDKIDIDIADGVSESLHGDASSFPSAALYLSVRNRFLIESDYRYFTATQYDIREFLLAIKNREL